MQITNDTLFYFHISDQSLKANSIKRPFALQIKINFYERAIIKDRHGMAPLIFKEIQLMPRESIINGILRYHLNFNSVVNI